VAKDLIKFDGFELDCDRYELRKGARALKLEKIPMELLILLGRSGGRLVTREEIEEKIWGKGVFVDAEHGINTAMRKVRQALGDDPEQPKFVQTVQKKGYRFIAEVRKVEAEYKYRGSRNRRRRTGKKWSGEQRWKAAMGVGCRRSHGFAFVARSEVSGTEADARREKSGRDPVDCSTTAGKYFRRCGAGSFCGWDDGRIDYHSGEVSGAASDFADVG